MTITTINSKIFHLIFGGIVVFILLISLQQSNGSAIELVQIEEENEDAIKVQQLQKQHAHNINEFKQYQQKRHQHQHQHQYEHEHEQDQQLRHESYDKLLSDVVVVNNNDLLALNNNNRSQRHNHNHNAKNNNADEANKKNVQETTMMMMTTSTRTGIEQHKRERRQVSDWLIAPNTRWCGRGNIANGTYNHLGGASSADKCCRKHDHCKFFIPAMSNRYELFNYRPYTLSHCTCDRRFRTCLKMANDEDANTIGKLFFNMVQTQCFILKQEHVCQMRNNDGSGSCMREIVRHKAYLKNNKKF